MTSASMLVLEQIREDYVLVPQYVSLRTLVLSQLKVDSRKLLSAFLKQRRGLVSMNSLSLQNPFYPLMRSFQEAIQLLLQCMEIQLQKYQKLPEKQRDKAQSLWLMLVLISCHLDSFQATMSMLILTTCLSKMVGTFALFYVLLL